MTDQPTISIQGTGICIPDEAVAERLGFDECGLAPTVLPPLIRRRTSLATRMAVTAADRACGDAGADRDMPAIFVSAVGEMQVTDTLCKAIADEAYPLSPTQFHNSVHNTAAGYWSIAVGSMEPMQAMSGLGDGFALALMEACCQINLGTEKLLLVCYDEGLTTPLLPGNNWDPLAVALVLSRADSGYPSVSLPWRDNAGDKQVRRFAMQPPVLETLPLVRALRAAASFDDSVELCGGPWRWFTRLIIP